MLSLFGSSYEPLLLFRTRNPLQALANVHPEFPLLMPLPHGPNPRLFPISLCLPLIHLSNPTDTRRYRPDNILSSYPSASLLCILCKNPSARTQERYCLP